MSANLADILKKLGWSEGFQIPLANDENRALENELANLSLKKSKGKNALDVVNGRLDSLKDHFKFVNQESEQTQKLLTAHKQRLDFIEDQYHVTQAEKDNTDRSSKSVMKKLKDLESRQEMVKGDLQKMVAKADQLKNEMDWDAKALTAWEETLKKRDEDNELIKKFSKEDEMRFNLLEAKRQHLQGVMSEMRAKAAKISLSACNQELILERSGKVMKQLFSERELLTFQWKDAIRMMRQRDGDVINVQEQIMTTLEMIQSQEDKLSEENNFLKNEQRNNHELDLELQQLNALNSRMRRDLNDLSKNMLIINTELHTVKRELANSSNHLQQQRMQSKQLTQQIEEKTAQCSHYEEEIEKMKQKLIEMKESTLSSNERIKKIENMIDKEEKYQSICISDTEKINSTLYRLDKLLQEQKEVGKMLEHNINYATCNCTQLRRHIRQLKKDLDKIKEVVYDMEFRIDDIEKKIYKIEADTKTDEDAEEKDKKIEELDRILANYKDVQHALQLQVDRLQEDMRRVSNVIASEKELLGITQNKCENLRLVHEIGQKQIAAAKKLTQEKQVEENMLRLRVHQIETDKHKEENNIFSLEKLRLNLDQAMKERQVEINTKKTIIQAKKRNLEEDRGRLKADIALRRVKIEHIKKKYHLALTSLGKNEEGEIVTVSQFKIKNAQEKYILQQQGDELDQKIKTAEKEIIAMENTLKVVNLSNRSFKNIMSPVKDNEEEIEEMQAVEDDFKRVTAQVKAQKYDLSQKEKALKDLELEIAEIEKMQADCQEEVTKLEEELQSVKYQQMEKQEKLNRANCIMKKILNKLGPRDISHYERDLELRQIRDLNKSVQKQLLLMCSTYPEIGNDIQKLFTEYNLQFKGPITPSTSGSSYSSLTTSCSSTESSQRNVPREPSSVSTVNLSLNN